MDAITTTIFQRIVDVPDGSLEPPPGVEHPPEPDEAEAGAERDGGVVEVAGADRVRRREEEHGAGVADPQERDEAHRPRRAPEVEGPRREVLLPHHHAGEDGHGVAADPADGCDRRDGREDDVDPQDGEAQQRARGGAEPDGVGGDAVARVDAAPHGGERDAAVAGQRVHDARGAGGDGEAAEEEGAPDDEEEGDGARGGAVPAVERVEQDLRRHERAGRLVARVEQVAEVLRTHRNRVHVRPFLGQVRDVRSHRQQKKIDIAKFMSTYFRIIYSRMF
ncbi:Os04g0435200 [Oryza sativa Japonica Group]|uniref:Os04g0435200 protein n=2 Tax=Oryza sativa subsp. japonica TaxID=39947 RepID=Q0JD26_ORYSJ|nr:hypothetical protein EE612_023418 [Oryza sativa]BAF14761.1 Os04g0435200 [Oryza sativa Japonica Group]BAS89299.1 Os04g0435200 [Oryza sativa Japonica Group]|eukprot:NP_001052847.1 Os04g0435200 [Oryza sativa Japonica Group]